MKKFVWLLALPWVVQISTQSYDCDYEFYGCDGYLCQSREPVSCKEEKIYTLYPAGFDCLTKESIDCSWIYDMRDAFNEAHEKRQPLRVEYGIWYPASKCVCTPDSEDCVCEK